MAYIRYSITIEEEKAQSNAATPTCADEPVAMPEIPKEPLKRSIGAVKLFAEALMKGDRDADITTLVGNSLKCKREISNNIVCLIK